MRTRLVFDIGAQDLDVFAHACQVQRMDKDCDHASRGELGMFLTRLEGPQRTVHDQESELTEGCYWRLDLPTLGTTVFGETPEDAMRAAIAAVVKDHQEESEGVSRG